MKGSTPTKAEKAFHDELASLGCIACFIAVHPWKARFEKQYGKQMEILKLCNEMLERRAA